MANTQPIFASVGHIGWDSAVSAANTTKDGTSGTIYTLFTAHATNGSYLQRIKIEAKGTNVATVMRVFLNNGSTTAAAANNSLIAQITLPATTNSEVAQINGGEIPLNMAIPPGYVVFVTLGTAVSAGFAVTAIGGDY